MGVIMTSNHPKLLWPGVKAVWGRTYNEHSPEYPDLFDEMGSTQNYEELVQVTGGGLAPIKSQGGSVTYADYSQGYVTRAVHVAYALGFIVTREERDDNLYLSKGGSYAKANAFSMRQTKEVVGAGVYNRAFNSSYVGGDGKELLATDHPSAAGTWSNELATAADFSESALEDLLVMIMMATNDKGRQINLMPKSLHVHPFNWFEANRVLKSTLQNDTANNAVNVLKMTNALPGGVKMNHYFTDTDAWFVRTNVQNGLTCFNRAKDELKQDNDFDTDNAKAKSYERYSFIWGDPRTLYGSPGA